MKTLRYIIGICMVVLVFAGCREDVDDMPPRMSDVRTEFVLPSPARLTNAERDVIQAKKDAYNALIEE